MLRGLLSLVLGLGLASAVGVADSWPQWRGPNRDAVSTEKHLRDHWEGTPPLLWKAEGLGKGYAGVAVDQGIVCTVGDRDEQTTVIVIRDKDGKEIWATPIDDVKGGVGNRFKFDKSRQYTTSKSTPTLDDERVYAVSSGGVLACLKTATGECIWRKSYLRDFDGIGPEWGYTESPLIDGDKLICTPGSPKAGIVALDKMTGRELWRCTPSFNSGKEPGGEGASYASAVVSHGAGVRQYVQVLRKGLVGIDAQTGKQLWSYSPAGAHTNPCTPIVRGDYVLAYCGEHRGWALLKLARTSNGGVAAKEVYVLEREKLKADFGGAVLVGDYVYANHIFPDYPQCVEFLTGKVMWEKQRGPGRGRAAVIYADSHLYFRYENGIVALVAATPDKYQLKGQFRMPDVLRREQPDSWAHPAISNGRLYLRQHGTLYCYDLRKG